MWRLPKLPNTMFPSLKCWKSLAYPIQVIVLLRHNPSASQQRKDAVTTNIQQIYDDSKQNYDAPKIAKEVQKQEECIALCYYPYDNDCIEFFHALIKRKWLNRFRIVDYNHAYRPVFEYIETFYNTVRIHSHCEYMSPNEFEDLYTKMIISNQQ